MSEAEAQAALAKIPNRAELAGQHWGVAAAHSLVDDLAVATIVIRVGRAGS
jgi:hypothetical protein